ncbi:hypothetical protein VF10_31605, partial [Nostoc linckia z13]|uniref:hypothetical protein n=1 Tax=Nostoc linckia TaxID=92942 RepID=UPI000C022B68
YVIFYIRYKFKFKILLIKIKRFNEVFAKNFKYSLHNWKIPVKLRFIETLSKYYFSRVLAEANISSN